jgi:hypothetical protein
MKKLTLIAALFMASCQSEDIQPPAPQPTVDCKCGIVTAKEFWAVANNAHYKYKVRNNCSNNNIYVNLDQWIQEGNTAHEGDYVCAQYEW